MAVDFLAGFDFDFFLLVGAVEGKFDFCSIIFYIFFGRLRFSLLKMKIELSCGTFGRGGLRSPRA